MPGVYGAEGGVSSVLGLQRIKLHPSNRPHAGENILGFAGLRALTTQAALGGLIFTCQRIRQEDWAKHLPTRSADASANSSTHSNFSPSTPPYAAPATQAPVSSSQAGWTAFPPLVFGSTLYEAPSSMWLDDDELEWPSAPGTASDDADAVPSEDDPDQAIFQVRSSSSPPPRPWLRNAPAALES